MKKLLLVFMVLLWFSACKKDTPISPLPPDQSIPTLSYQLAGYASTQKFYAFGDTLPTGELNKGFVILLADTTQNFSAACKGIVTGITPQPGGYNTIAVKYKENSIYSFVYDGIRNVQVHVNDSIKASTVLGKIGNAGLISFMLIKNDNTALCPTNYSSAGFGIAAAINMHNSLNPGDSIYNPCVVESLPK